MANEHLVAFEMHRCHRLASFQGSRRVLNVACGERREPGKIYHVRDVGASPGYVPRYLVPGTTWSAATPGSVNYDYRTRRSLCSRVKRNWALMQRSAVIARQLD